MSFADLGLSDELLSAVLAAGYDMPTPIQAQAIPSVLMMRDIIGIAQTGTGKTASFVLPMIDVLAHGRARARMPRSLILEPTRELAAQVAENFEKYGVNHKLSMALLIGGVSMGDQIKALEKGVDVLIATPGRLMDLFERGNILLNGCELLVIDEADRMLDMGFIGDIESIIARLPQQRQTLLFSATLEGVVGKLAERITRDAKRIEIAKQPQQEANIEQRLMYADDLGHKTRLLDALLRDADLNQAVVFTSTKMAAEDISTELRANGFQAGALHGDMNQGQRNRTLQALRQGRMRVLVATDVAARGIDVAGVSHVINFDLPRQVEDYVHRIGRTGRAGRSGIAVSLASVRERGLVRAIERYTTKTMNIHTIEGMEPKIKPSPERNGDRRNQPPRHGQKSGYGNRSEGFGGQRREGGFGGQRREGGFEGQRREGGFGGQRREGGFEGQRREGGFGGQRREGGFDNQRREGGFGGQRREGGFGGQRPDNNAGARRDDNFGNRAPREGQFADRHPRSGSPFNDNRGNGERTANRGERFSNGSGERRPKRSNADRY